MNNLIKARYRQGYQAIKDIKKAVINEKNRGFPILKNDNCNDNNCVKCIEICPTKAITKEPLKIDIGKCVFCGYCAIECKNEQIKFSNYHKTASTEREYLIIDNKKTPDNYSDYSVKTRREIKKIFGRSLKLRSVSAAGCNGCELELNACSNVNFDMGRFGIDILASPRHTDGIVITGPISDNMADPLEDALKSIPEPKIVILAGSCAISGGIFANSKAINRNFLEKHNIDLYIPGCPIHPLTMINGILDLLGI